VLDSTVRADTGTGLHGNLGNRKDGSRSQPEPLVKTFATIRPPPLTVPVIRPPAPASVNESSRLPNSTSTSQVWPLVVGANVNESAPLPLFHENSAPGALTTFMVSVPAPSVTAKFP